MRVYEGKALLANISIPAALLVSIRLWLNKDGRNKESWVLLFIAAVSALTFSGSSYLSCGSQYGDPSGDGAEEKDFLRDSLCALYAAGIFVCPGLFFRRSFGWIAFSGIIGNWEDTMDRRRKWRELTIEELGLRFCADLYGKIYWSGCLLPVFFSGRYTLGYFLPQEKRIQSVPVLSSLSGTYGI